MATSVTISPSLGHAPLFTQAGIGASPGYDAIDVRRIAQAAGAFQEGVFDATGWKVTQNAGGANMTVDVAANVGLAVVTGDSVTAQSRYVIPPHSAVADLDIGSNATGNPRVDQVVLQVREDTHDGSGSNDVRVLVLAGTATSGANLNNHTGAATLPASALRLAYVLVASGASSITNSVIQDVRPDAHPRRDTGDIFASARSGAAAGTLLCDGSAINRAAYASLFAAIDTAYGAGDGSTTFNLPDLRGRGPVGLGTHTDVDTLGDSDGSAVANRSPKHNHTVTDPGHSHVMQRGSGGPTGTGLFSSTFDQNDLSSLPATTGITVGATGRGTDTPAFLVVNFFIATGMAA